MGVEPNVAISTGFCGSVKRSSARSRSGLKHDDRHAAAGDLVQRAHHARMVGAGIVAHRDDQLAMVEIVE